jgi:hypothetical protein
MSIEDEKLVLTWAEKLKNGEVPPWKVEDEIVSSGHAEAPYQFKLAALARQRYLEEETGETFHSITVPEKPYKLFYRCDKENLGYELDAEDISTDCLFCGEKLRSIGEYAPLVANYIGGVEAYYSFAGRIKVMGTSEKTYTNLLVYGTGLGPIGVTRGCYLINRFGGASVEVADYGQAVRALGFIFESPNIRQRAIEVIENNLPSLKGQLELKWKEFRGEMLSVDFDCAESDRGYLLFVEFVTKFENFRGHGDTSRAVGFIKGVIEALFQAQGVGYQMGIIAQGHDGDLKPSPKNKRGRNARAEVCIPVEKFEDSFSLTVDRFLAAVELDGTGAQKLGCQFYSGMGGEIIPAVYKATKVNPQSSLVTSFENISAGIENKNLVYRVELPNVEVGVASNREGLIPPSGREALRFMGIQSAKDFASSLAAQVLAGEFNLALEIALERLYRPQ